MFALVARIESRSYSISDRMARCYQPHEPHAREAAPVLAIRARASRDDVSRVALWSRRVARCSVRCILDVVSTNGDMHAVSARCRQSAMPSMRCADARNRARRTRDDARSPSRCGCEKITQSTLLTLVGKCIRVSISPTTGAMCSVRCKQWSLQRSLLLSPLRSALLPSPPRSERLRSLPRSERLRSPL